MFKGKPLINYLTIDVEDYFHVHAFADAIQPSDWDKFDCRVEKNVDNILELLDEGDAEGNRVKATFFILGWIAERYPDLIKKIHRSGHEIASHGYGHRVIYSQSKQEFREDIKRSKQILEALTGEQVFGYRAPTYSITEKTLWALYILEEEGYCYDSSIFPIRHDNYGMPSCPRFPFVWDLSRDQPESKDFSRAEFKNLGQSGLVEFPISTVRFFSNNFPCSGGGYFRIFPYYFITMCLNCINREDRPFIFYLHPWELDPGIPQIKNISFLSKYRTYVNLSRTKTRFKKLLSEFKFLPLKAFIFS
jgi:polysaccharide deacetylase family protein (PEP-CTERM system associated)